MNKLKILISGPEAGGCQSYAKTSLSFHAKRFPQEKGIINPNEKKMSEERYRYWK